MTGVGLRAQSAAGLSTRAVVGVTLAIVAGAVAARPTPWLVGLMVGLVALAHRSAAVAGLALAVAASGLGAAAWAGLDPPEPERIEEAATLVADPRPVGRGVRADVRLGDGRRVRAWAFGPAATALEDRLAGERVVLVGLLRPLPEEQRRFLASRHLVGTVTVERVGAGGAGGLLARVANGVHRTIGAGAGSLSPRDRSLLTGLTVGDDRHVPSEVVDQFRASGLSHLLAVSGSNVALVLALAAPLAARLGPRGRAGALVLVLVVFGTVTRWEPSVLRATAMAAVAVAGSTTGRSGRGVRALAVAVAVLVLVDPLLVQSVGFRLSAGASLGIAVLAEPIRARLPGPRPLAEAVAVTSAAQVGVAPALLATFGELPLASLPANVLAGPAAGPVMAWGSLAGTTAGWVGEPWASLLHLPTRLLVGWVALVAERCAHIPGDVTDPAAAVVVTAAGLLLVWRGAATVGRR